MLVAGLVAAGTCSAADQDIFTDALQNGWQDWSWAAVTMTNTTPVQSGARSIRVSAGAWEALYLQHPAQDAGAFRAVTFWVNGGATGGQLVWLRGLAGGNPVLSTNLPPLPTNAWQQITVSFATLGLTNQSNFDGFYLQERTGSGQPVFYVDGVALLGVTNAAGTNGGAAVIGVDVAAGRRRIDPRIYGVAYASSNQLRLLNAPLNRQGGNPTSRYNWQLNADNRAFDYFFRQHRLCERDAGRTRRQFCAGVARGRRGAEPDGADAGLGGRAGAGPRADVELFRGQVWRAAAERRGEWLAGHGERRARQRVADHHQRSQRRECAGGPGLPGGLAAPSDEPLGARERGRGALLPSR